MELFRGYFVNAFIWNSFSLHQQNLQRISAIASAHPTWPVCMTSAAELYGVNLPRKLHAHVHFACDSKTSSARRKTSPVRFHYIKGSRSRRRTRNKYFHSLRNSSYVSINNKIGYLRGLLVTSPLQTIFDCARTLPIEYALIVADQLAHSFGITSKKAVAYARQQHRCWKSSTAIYVLQFLDARSENGGESFSRARMLQAGFARPLLQVEIPNPLRRLDYRHEKNFQRTRTIRPDFLWKIKAIRAHSDSHYNSQIIAELDGREKYLNPHMNKYSTPADVILREKDRETALALAGFTIIRFQFSEVEKNGGDSMIGKLKLGGVPHVGKWEMRRRQRFLISDITHKRHHQLD
ncbi:hypothetical protein ACFQY8_03025 [Alloscardovia venturai]|uniref:Uncharacterized protein n=1 Tax=Alloscardovia venturai TaxID=1769421 RepID=A0ABW2Y398_9BIFI